MAFLEYKFEMRLQIAGHTFMNSLLLCAGLSRKSTFCHEVNLRIVLSHIIIL